MNIVFAYFGKSAPDYLIKNLNLHAMRFREHQVWFLTNSEMWISGDLDKGVKVFHIDKYQKSDAMIEIFGHISAEKISFRNGYWQLTILRILAVQDFQEKFQEPLIHVEGDVLLMPNFPFEKLKSVELVSYPLVNRGYGCASTLYSPSNRELSLLRDFFQKEIQTNNSLTDMDLLGMYQESHPERVFCLPSAPRDPDAFNDWVSGHEKDLLSNGFEFFGGLFDGMTIGQFLLGEDPMNHFGRRPIYRSQSHHSYAPSRSTFGWEESGPYIKFRDCRFNIYSLHVHSKDLRVFDKTSGMDLVRKRVLEKSDCVKYEMIPRLMLLLLPSLIEVKCREVLRKVKKFLKSRRLLKV